MASSQAENAHVVKRGNAKLTGQILLRNCFIKHVIDGKMEGLMEVTGRQRRRRRKQLVDDVM